jgi:hypothetical protein
MIDPWISEIARQRQQERLGAAERRRLLATGAARRAPAWGGIHRRLGGFRPWSTSPPSAAGVDPRSISGAS